MVILLSLKAVADSLTVNVNVIGLLVNSVTTLGVMVIVGLVLSTVKVVLGPAAGAALFAVSIAVPAAMLMPSVPFPVMLEIVTVRVVPEPETPNVPLAVPVLFRVMLPVTSV